MLSLLTKPLITKLNSPLTRVSLRYASKKAGGQSNNGRTSWPKSRGLKKGNWEAVKKNDILVTQKGTKFHPGENTILSKDFTIHSKIDGYMVVHRQLIYHNPRHKPSLRWRKYIHVVKEKPKESTHMLDIR
eukprot:TRINITY_DN5702_c0_g1_i6.p1 TRINITY_DN5702_c0_g1~~TRINITY_DN5702_c0_g1_i6.p1  ORF type:complete len:131 (-),score=8.98 TRINITY_DN5702_c0_g1_i6:44-436(-)